MIDDSTCVGTACVILYTQEIGFDKALTTEDFHNQYFVRAQDTFSRSERYTNPS